MAAFAGRAAGLEGAGKCISETNPDMAYIPDIKAVVLRFDLSG